MNQKERLQSFISAMEEWEIWNHVENRKPEYHGEYREKQNQEAKERLLAIFTEFLTRRALDKNGTPHLWSLSYSRPPTYSQEIEDEFEEKRVHTYLYAHHKRWPDYSIKRKYDLVREDGEWKIDAVFSWYESSKRWCRKRCI
jgi:ADP-heptose:LPS heptosyltransferase